MTNRLGLDVNQINSRDLGILVELSHLESPDAGAAGHIEDLWFWRKWGLVERLIESDFEDHVVDVQSLLLLLVARID